MFRPLMQVKDRFQVFCINLISAWWRQWFADSSISIHNIRYGMLTIRKHSLN